TSPRARIAAELSAQATPDIARRWFAQLFPAEQAHALALVQRGTFAAVLVEAGLTADAREVRRAAARTSERVVVSGAIPGVQRAWNANRDDPYLGALLLRVLAKVQPEQVPVSLVAYAERFGPGSLRRNAHELAPLLQGADIKDWQIRGPLPSVPSLLASAEPPPVEGRADDPWRALDPPARDGYADLKGLAHGDTGNSLVFAQLYLRVDVGSTVHAAFGSDDGARVWLGGRLVYENRARKEASPLETLLALELQTGWNRLVLEIENGTGEFGFYFRLLDATVEVADAPH
ncbi:MAG: hypothetical protein HOP15_06605, partial [Planctomycetes bacterium]|nr:hypothetical protein [Planctomycetota bacterium]